MRYYGVVKSSFNYNHEKCESKRAHLFRCLIFSLLAPCELLFEELICKGAYVHFSSF